MVTVHFEGETDYISLSDGYLPNASDLERLLPGAYRSSQGSTEVLGERSVEEALASILVTKARLAADRCYQKIRKYGWEHAQELHPVDELSVELWILGPELVAGHGKFQGWFEHAYPKNMFRLRIYRTPRSFSGYDVNPNIWDLRSHSRTRLSMRSRKAITKTLEEETYQHLKQLANAYAECREAVLAYFEQSGHAFWVSSGLPNAR